MPLSPKALLLAGLAGVSLIAGNAAAQTPAPPPAAAPAAPEPAPEHTLAAKFAGYSEYEYRGISQTSEKPAAQMNLDYSHSSGIYVGTFLSNIKWLKDTADVNGFSTSANVEWDIYGGYKFEIVKDVTLDLGYLRYEYPNSSEFDPKPNTDEFYIGAAYGPLSAKYSYSVNNTFGVPNSKGSDYFEIDYNQAITPVSDKLTFNGVLGHQTYAHNGALSYTVWKAGATWDFGNGWNVGGYVKGTNAEHDLYTVKGKDWSETRLVGFVTYTWGILP